MQRQLLVTFLSRRQEYFRPRSLFETKIGILRQLRMDKNLDKRKVEAFAVLSLSTVILIVCFSMGLVLLSLQALEAKLEMGAGQPVHVIAAPWKKMASNRGEGMRPGGSYRSPG
jgi:hypothetical protein